MTTYTHRYLARIVVQAEAPFAVGSGERDVLTNRLVVTDCNGLPYIPGTALAGVLKHSLRGQFDNSVINTLLGFQIEKEQDEKIRETKKREPTEKEKGQGSKLILSHAQMVGCDGLPIDGLTEIDWTNEFYEPYQNLPVRQHVRISHRGAGSSEDHGKFDEQVVYKGTRFCFELELGSDGKKEDEEFWMKMLELFQSPLFRIGGGTRKGFGELLVIECKTITLDLSKPEKLDLYLGKTSELNDSFWNGYSDIKKEHGQSADWVKYELYLKPDDFFLFSSGLESSDAKMIPVTEKAIKWDDPKKPEFTKEQILIPATSVKGALAHRVAFHFNQLNGVFADTLSKELLEEKNYEFKVDSKAVDKQGKLFEIATIGNPAVRALFGYSAKGDEGIRGNVVFSDLFKGEINSAKRKILNHVSIDRFTGGAMEGALFNEEVIYKEDDNYILTMQVHKVVLKDNVEKAFDLALNDLASGLLPLGGGTMRGHGCFTGKITKNGEELRNGNN